jgi:drug/metabolite transporter superfamily protein YnfA
VIATLLALTVAAIFEVWGDHLIRKGLPRDAGRLLLGALVLAAYGFAVNLWWRGDFSKLLGLYVVFFFLASQLWGVAFEGEHIDTPRIVGGALIVMGGLVIQWWRPG